MTLSIEEGRLFIKLMWGLQAYVNRQLALVKKASSAEQYGDLPTEKRLKVRNALWKHPHLIEEYLRENPDSLPAEDLEVVRRWSGFIQGSFFILRHLKKGSVFISQGGQIYLVHGIQDPLEEIIPSNSLPQLVKAVLLPFKGLIVYDGLLERYNVFFGSGISADIEHTYTVARHKKRIISSLEPDLAKPAKLAPKGTKDLLPKLQDLRAELSRLKGNEALQNAALALTRTSLDLAIAANDDPANIEKLAPSALKVRRAATRLYQLLEIASEE
jgi:hypothetical protein